MFNLEETPEFNQTKSVTLEPNKIHKVEFKGVELKTVGEEEKKVIEFKFENETGSFSHTEWEPREEDMQDNDRGSFVSPSDYKQSSARIKQILSVVNPEFYSKLKSGEASLEAKDYEEFRQKLAEALNEGIGVSCEIKLLKYKDKPVFERWPLAYNKDNVEYARTSIIAKSNLMFTDKEKAKINAESTSPDNLGGIPSGIGGPGLLG